MAKKIEYDRDRRTPYKSYGYIGTFGRASVKIVCPFCGTIVTAYIWSLAGGGKKCPDCGAIHTAMGGSFPIKKPTNDKETV